MYQLIITVYNLSTWENHVHKNIIVNINSKILKYIKIICHKISFKGIVLAFL